MKRRGMLSAVIRSLHDHGLTEMSVYHLPLLLVHMLHLSHHQNDTCAVTITKLQTDLNMTVHQNEEWQRLLGFQSKYKDKLLLEWAETGDSIMVEKLLKMNANVSVQNSHKSTPLHLAALKGHLEVARALLDAGADTEVRNKHNNTPLIWAAHNNHLEICRLLLDRGANVNVSDVHGNTPLHYASWFGYFPIVQLLIERGADVKAKNDMAKTPEEMANNEHREDIAIWLRNHG